MLNKIVKIFIGFTVGGISFTVVHALISVGYPDLPVQIKWAIIGLAAVIGILAGYAVAPRVIAIVVQTTKWLETRMHKMPTQDIIGGVIGLILGLIIANLFGASFQRLPYVGYYLPIVGSLILGYLGWSFGVKKREELLSPFLFFQRSGSKEKASKVESKSQYKILDTSVIIDGRIADICKSGFIDGTLIIPSFVLEELRHIADSSDLLKRNRGRRGLDILNRIRKELDVMVRIHEKDYEDLAEVDSKLVRLAKEMGAQVITNDYNLNKVAELQGIRVLNINELANAVKPVVLPGEEMQVQVIKDGKEAGQGVAYLDDGTMIVVENGRRYIGQNIAVLVTSVLQTAAGRMIFAKPKNHYDKRQGSGHHQQVDRGDYQWIT
ncbi:MAG: PIN/TRAM domain-containing protein [Syntrophomonadaceae bacterium]|nr:PIN/TRAM domain-containing protein [Syntrophomonadaceae bacterium]